MGELNLPCRGETGKDIGVNIPFSRLVVLEVANGDVVCIGLVAPDFGVVVDASGDSLEAGVN